MDPGSYLLSRDLSSDKTADGGKAVWPNTQCLPRSGSGGVRCRGGGTEATSWEADSGGGSQPRGADK